MDDTDDTPFFRYWLHEHTFPMAMAYADLVELGEPELDQKAWQKLVADCRQHDENGLLPYSRALDKHKKRLEAMVPADADLLRMAQVLGTLTVNHEMVGHDLPFWTQEATTFLEDVPYLLEPAFFPQPYGKLDRTVETWDPQSSFMRCWHEMSLIARWGLVRLHAEWTHRARNAVAVRLGVDPMDLGDPEADTIFHPPAPQRIPFQYESDELYWELRLLLSTCRDVPHWVPWVLIRQYALTFGPYRGQDDLDILENHGDPLEEVFIARKRGRRR